MKSALRKLRNQKTPVPMDSTGRALRGHSYNLGNGRQDRETFMRQYGMSGTLYAIISLLAESSATPTWRLYKSQPVDGRRRYSTADRGDDQRIEVVQHAAIKLWNNPNDFHSGFEFREATQQHQELTGEAFWILDNEVGFPTSLWCVRPDRLEPVSDPDQYLLGYIYTGPNGEQVPLRNNEVILEKRPDPLDPYRGAGPVASILPNIQQQRYATEYQRNLFYNGAMPGGIITVPNELNEQEFDELIDRWREAHRGVARAGHVGVLENGATWTPAASNKDMEYAQLRLNNRDEIREAWRIHKTMLGTADDVNRANAQTAQEVFVAWQVMPRLNRRRDTLNSKFLPMFGTTGVGVEFDYDDPSPVNAETAANELLQKAQSAQALIAAGFDPHDVLEAVGLPDMGVADMMSGPEPGSTFQVPAKVPGTPPTGDVAAPENRKDAASKVFQQVSQDFPATATAWMHHAAWKGPVSVPLEHIDWTPNAMDGADQDKVDRFADRLRAGKKLKPVILVKTPNNDKLVLVDGHHRYLAAADLELPIKGFIGTVDADHGPWESMHDAQYDSTSVGNAAALSKAQVNYRDATEPNRRCGTCSMFREPNACTLVKGLIRPDGVCDRWASKESMDSAAAMLRRVLTDGYVPIETAGRR